MAPLSLFLTWSTSVITLTNHEYSPGLVLCSAPPPQTIGLHDPGPQCGSGSFCCLNIRMALLSIPLLDALD